MFAIATIDSGTGDPRDAGYAPPGSIGDTRDRRRKSDVTDDRRAFFEDRVSVLLNKLYGVAMRLTGNSHDAEDLVATTIAHAWERLEQLDDLARFDAWLFKSLSNRYISTLRARRPEAFLDDCLCEEPDDEDGYLYRHLHSPFLLWWGGPEKEFLANLVREDIERAVNELADEYRVVFVLVEVLGYKYEEAAGQIGVPVGTVRSRLNRARQKLQKTLWKYGRELESAPGNVKT